MTASLLNLRPRRIALLKPSALGDIVHSLPVLSALKELYPSSSIDWIVNRSFEPLIVGHPDLHATVPFQRGAFKGLWKSLSYSVQFADQLRKNRYDLVVDLQGLLRTGIMAAATGAPVRVGFAKAREGSRHAYTHRIDVPDATRIHAVDRYWRVVEALGGGHLAKRFHVPLHPRELQTIDREFRDYPRQWIALAPGAKWLTKRWPPAHFADLVNRARAEFGGTVFLVGAAEDAPLALEIQQRSAGGCVDLTGKTSLPKLAALLARADVMLANDTGPLHLAAALGTPCIAPYTCTIIAKHGPYGSRHTGIETSVPCAGSYLRQCPNGMICMDELTPERLWPALKSVLSRAEPPPLRFSEGAGG